MVAESMECAKLDALAETVAELKEALYRARLVGVPLHVVERDIARELVQKMGRLALEGYIEMHGTGDVGPVAVSPRENRRLRRR